MSSLFSPFATPEFARLQTNPLAQARWQLKTDLLNWLAETRSANLFEEGVEALDKIAAHRLVQDDLLFGVQFAQDLIAAGRRAKAVVSAEIETGDRIFQAKAVIGKFSETLEKGLDALAGVPALSFTRGNSPLAKQLAMELLAAGHAAKGYCPEALEEGVATYEALSKEPFLQDKPELAGELALGITRVAKQAGSFGPEVFFAANGALQGLFSYPHLQKTPHVIPELATGFVELAGGAGEAAPEMFVCCVEAIQAIWSSPMAKEDPRWAADLSIDFLETVKDGKKQIHKTLHSFTKAFRALSKCEFVESKPELAKGLGDSLVEITRRAASSAPIALDQAVLVFAIPAKYPPVGAHPEIFYRVFNEAAAQGSSAARPIEAFNRGVIDFLERTVNRPAEGERAFGLAVHSSSYDDSATVLRKANKYFATHQMEADGVRSSGNVHGLFKGALQSRERAG